MKKIKYRQMLHSGLFRDGVIVNVMQHKVSGKRQLLWEFLPDGWETTIPCYPEELTPLH